MNRIISLSLIIGLVAVSCTDPNTIGLELQPESDIIVIINSDFEVINSDTESEDSLRSDEALNLILGGIDDPEFGFNNAAFITQILLTENNTDLGLLPTVDSVVLSYTYSSYYGDLEEFIRECDPYLKGEITVKNIERLFSNEILEAKLR